MYASSSILELTATINNISLHITMSLSNFPVHLLEEIFTRLAVKTLIILTSVCKPWLALISSQSFVQLHLSRYDHLHPNNHMLLLHHLWHQSIIISPLNFSGIPTVSRTPIPASQNWIRAIETRSTHLSRIDLTSSLMQTFVGSIDGLVCFSRPAHRPTNVVIWNPATHRFKDILVPSVNNKKFFKILVAFGFNYAVDDYKIVCVYTSHPLSFLSCYFQMYSCRGNSWKELKLDSPLNMSFSSECVNVKGNPYWKCYCKQMKDIWVKVNVQSEAIQLFSGLEYVKNKTTSTSIMALGDSVAQAVFSPGAESNDMIHVYTLEEYSGVWIRMYTFDFVGLERPVRFKCYKNNKIVFTTGNHKELFMYDLTSMEIKDLTIREGREMYRMPINYTESLVAIEGMESHERILHLQQLQGIVRMRMP